jgi:nucleotide-binding universal stress UspA family protein
MPRGKSLSLLTAADLTEKTYDSAVYPWPISWGKEPIFVYTRVLVPLDGPELAEQVLPLVTPLAKVLKLQVVLVRVIPSVLEYCLYMEYPAAEHERPPVSLHTKAMDYLKEAGDRLRLQGIHSVDERLLFGSPAAAIVDLARETPDSLVAVTTHGRSGVRRWVLGSVADRVVCHSNGPVLLIRPVEDDSK